MLSVVVLLPAGGVAAGVAFPSPLGAALWGVVNKNQSRYWVFFYRVFQSVAESPSPHCIAVQVDSAFAFFFEEGN